MRKYAVVGSRDYPNLRAVRHFIDGLPDDDCVISGNARGVDKCAQEMALNRSMVVIIAPAQWDKYGKGAGFKRNSLMVKWADEIVAFWDGFSPGTKSTIELAQHAGKKVTVYGVDGDVVDYTR